VNNPDTRVLQKTYEFAKRHYSGRTTLLGQPLLDHCMSVARQSEVIAQKLYRDVRADFLPDKTRESINSIVQIALLHDVLNVSACAFEHIAETATVHVAAMVADISKDFRLVETKRDMEFRGRLSQSPVGAQIVIVADVICTAKDLLTLLQKNGLTVAAKVKKMLAQFDADLLAIHAANRYYVLRMYVHAARNLLTSVSQTIKELKAKAKVDKIVQQSTKRLRERVENEAKDKKDKPRNTVKKKEQSCAKKHRIE
jgi:(p)ppGpp synthase/HD superfamily hydrolase